MRAELSTGVPGSLSADQIAHYREQGYVVVPRLLGDEQIERYLRRAREIALGDHPKGAASRLVRDIRYAKRWLPMPDDPELALWKMLNPDRFDAVLGECLRLPRVLDCVESLLGPDLLAFLLMFIYKPPGLEDAIHPFHQDAFFFPFGPHDSVCGVWIPLDPADADNGSLCFVPGSHLGPVRPHVALEGVNAGALAASGVEEDPEIAARAVTLPLDPGDCVIFHSRMLHRTGGNRTKRHRRVITLHFASARCTATAETGVEYGFTPVRGRTYEGCLQPLASPPLGIGGRRSA